MKLSQLIAARAAGIEMKSSSRRPDRRDGILVAVFIASHAITCEETA
ncbi:MAG: hypothetical protein J0M26_29495 [Planctomycetes bacterium]|nr:hypothetical protein [Planctomycetota bacterium]